MLFDYVEDTTVFERNHFYIKTNSKFISLLLNKSISIEPRISYWFTL